MQTVLSQSVWSASKTDTADQMSFPASNLARLSTGPQSER